MTTPQPPTPTPTPQSDKSRRAVEMSTGFAWLCDYQDMQKLEREVDALKEQNAVLQSQVDNADATWQQQKLCTDQIREQLRQRDEQLKAANELRVSGGDTCKSGIVRAFVEFPAGTPIRVVGTFGQCLAAHRARTGGK